MTLAVVLACVLVLIRLRKRKRITSQPTDDINTGGFFEKPELEGSTAHRPLEKQELEAKIASIAREDNISQNPHAIDQIQNTVTPEEKGRWPIYATELGTTPTKDFNTAYSSPNPHDTGRAELGIEPRTEAPLLNIQKTESANATKVRSPMSIKNAEVGRVLATTYKAPPNEHLNLARENSELDELRIRESEAWGGGDSG